MQIITVGRRTLVAKTCLTCGQLRPGEAYPRTGGGYRDSYCDLCHNVKTKPLIHSYQQQAKNAAVKHRDPWTEEEVLKLSEMFSDGRTGPEIAMILNRTVYAVYTMKSKLKKETEA